MVLGGIVLALALPITIFLTQQEQDIRQDASGYTCGTGYPQKSGTCPNGWDCQQVTQSNNPFYNRYQCVERNPAPGTLPGTKHPTATPATNGGTGGTTASLTSIPKITGYSSVTCNSITIKWDRAEPNNAITAQRIVWRINDGTTNWQFNADVNKSATSYTASGLNPNVYYMFSVGAAGSDGQYKWSNPTGTKTSSSCGAGGLACPVRSSSISISCTGTTVKCTVTDSNSASILEGSLKYNTDIYRIESSRSVTNCRAAYGGTSTCTLSSDGKVLTQKNAAPGVYKCVSAPQPANNSCDTPQNRESSECTIKTPTPTPPPCNMSPTCSGSCSAPNNTCGDSNGTQTCTFNRHTTEGGNCYPAQSTRPCGVDKCQNGNSCVNGQCAAPKATNTPTPTRTPSPTRTPTVAVTPITTTAPTATPTDGAGVGNDETLITLNITLPGIGGNTITSGPGSTSNNENPIRTTRDVEVLLGDSTGANITTLATGDQDPASGTLTFDATTYSYKGDVSLGDLPTGNYQIFVRFDNTLYQAVSGYPLVTKGQKTNIAQTKLASGDISRSETGADNMTLDDYTLFMACYREMEICTAEAKVRSDLDDNGTLDTIDLLLLQRTFANREGDSPL